MGFKTPSLSDAYNTIRSSLVEINSPYNDGITASHCKQELYLLKCWLEDQYDRLPIFEEDERRWEQERIVQLLKKQ